MIFTFKDPHSDYSLTIEDDRSVAYAYLSQGANVVNDVWLYNHGLAPTNPDWDRPGAMPCKNIQSYIFPGIFHPIENESEIRIEWLRNNDQSFQGVQIFLRNELFALLKPGDRPGHSKLVMKDGPLARVLGV